MKFFILVAFFGALSLADATAVSTVVRPVPAGPTSTAPVPVAPVTTAPSTCPCTMPNSIQDGFQSETTPVFKAEAVETRMVGDSHYSYTVMRVKVVFRGCTPANEYIIVKSPKTAAACGVQFVPGTMYAVTAKLSRSATPPPGLPSSMEVYTATSCSYNKPWSSCPYDEKVFLYYSPVRGCSS